MQPLPITIEYYTIQHVWCIIRWKFFRNTFVRPVNVKEKIIEALGKSRGSARKLIIIVRGGGRRGIGRIILPVRMLRAKDTASM